MADCRLLFIRHCLKELLSSYCMDIGFLIKSKRLKMDMGLYIDKRTIYYKRTIY